MSKNQDHPLKIVDSAWNILVLARYATAYIDLALLSARNHVL